jgi:hypothetical protein
MQALMVTVPAGVLPGQQFRVRARNTAFELAAATWGVLQYRTLHFEACLRLRADPPPTVPPPLRHTHNPLSNTRTTLPFAQQVVAGAQEMMVTCPLHCGPGATVRIDVPAAPQHPTPAPTPPAPQTSRAMQVTVPAGVVAGQSFRVQIAGGGDVMVACPPNCGPGSALRIEVPITQPTAGGGAAGAADTVRSYARGGGGGGEGGEGQGQGTGVVVEVEVDR